MINKEFLTLPIDEVIPYENNPRINDSAVNDVVASIRQCENIDPIEIDENNVILSGHTRLKALKALEYPEVQVLRITGLTDEQKRKYRILANKTAEKAEWDFEKLELELDGLDFDGFDFGFGESFSIDDIEEVEESTENPKADNDRSMQNDAFENQEIMQFQILNYYGIPEIQPTQTAGDKFLRFMDWKEIEDYENYIAHFYYDDYKFMSAWREPYKFVDRLKKFKAVIAPDFSLYTDFPRALQILSCYRRNWCAAYWQSLGIDVIPDVVWGDKESYDFCFEGIPKRSTAAVSSVGVKRDKQWNNRENSLFVSGYNEMMNRLEPTAILYYGDMIDGLEGNIICVPSFYEQKREYLNERAVAKKNGQRKQ